MLGEYSLFSWKSKSTQAREAEEYEKWAFPYGEAHRSKLEALLEDLFGKESATASLIQFLTCKELFEQVLKKQLTEDATVDHMINEIKKYKQIIRKKEMPKFVAVVLAERRIDHNLNYPAAEEVLSKARELEARRAD